ncbi:MAG: elongation factor G [Proteobacteria bacterium]|nr:elongation factor G [Pseudomonadota bacterium]
MKGIDIKDVRNIGLFGHNGVGKTSLGEAFLFNAKVTNRLNKVDEGNSILDYTEDEIDKKMSVSLSTAYFKWQEKAFTLLDAPGYIDFIADVYSAVKAIDSAVLVFDALSGFDVGAEKAYSLISKDNKSMFIVINKIAKEHAKHEDLLKEITDTLGIKAIPVQLPMGEGVDFKGVIDLLSKKAYFYKNGKMEAGEIPSEYNAQVDKAIEKFVEAVAQTTDELTEKYLEELSLTDEEIEKGIKAGILNGTLYPILYTDASINFGTELLIDFLAKYAPSPADIYPVKAYDASENEVEINADSPLSGIVFKTIIDPHLGEMNFVRLYSSKIAPGSEIYDFDSGNSEKVNQLYIMTGNKRIEVDGELSAGDIGLLVKMKSVKTNHRITDKKNPVVVQQIEFPEPTISLAIEPKDKNDEEKVAGGLTRLNNEDPTFVYKFDPELKQTLIYGMGEAQFDIMIKKLKSKFGVSVEVKKPKIPYRETIRKVAEAQGKYKKQSGGHGQYGDVWVKFEPLKDGEFEFVDAVVGGVVPRNYIPSVEKGLKEVLGNGFLAGYKMVGIRATLYDGSYHSVDSSDMAFKVAASLAFKNAMPKADPILLEPIMEVEVYVPESFMGDVMGDLSSRRGKILGMEAKGKQQIIRALVPQAELYKYSTQLRSMTQGKGSFTQKFVKYESVPHEIAEKVIEESKLEKENEK